VAKPLDIQLSHLYFYANPHTHTHTHLDISTSSTIWWHCQRISGMLGASQLVTQLTSHSYFSSQLFFNDELTVYW